MLLPCGILPICHGFAPSRGVRHSPNRLLKLLDIFKLVVSFALLAILLLKLILLIVVFLGEPSFRIRVLFTLAVSILVDSLLVVSRRLLSWLDRLCRIGPLVNILILHIWRGLSFLLWLDSGRGRLLRAWSAVTAVLLVLCEDVVSDIDLL